MSTNDADTDWRPALAEGIRVETVGQELILLNRQAERVHQLDPVGARIVAACDGKTTIAEIILQLSTEFDVGVDTLRKDVIELLKMMQELQLIR